jgi:hypothetical protein
MNPNKQQSVALGVLLIVLGLVWWLNLWSLIWPGALAAAGVIAYRQRRRAGRPVEAVQAGLWCIGLALLFLVDFVWPGVLFLAGASILIRGREVEVDEQIRRTVAQAGSQRRAVSRAITTQQVPITTHQAPAHPAAPQTAGQDAPATGQTAHLHE